MAWRTGDVVSVFVMDYETLMAPEHDAPPSAEELRELARVEPFMVIRRSDLRELRVDHFTGDGEVVLASGRSSSVMPGELLVELLKAYPEA